MHDLRILLRIEFKRAFKSKAFYICLAIGIALAAGSFINKAVPHMDVLKGFTGNAASYPFSVYNSWMGNFVGYEPFATAYLYVCMLYSALPYCGFFIAATIPIMTQFITGKIIVNNALLFIVFTHNFVVESYNTTLFDINSRLTNITIKNDT